MTDQQLQEIQERLANITPGEWKRDTTIGSIPFVRLDDGTPIVSHHFTDVKAWNDCNFIAHAPADVSALLTELSKARKLLAAASHGLKSYQFGNVGPDLAESLVSKIDEALNEPPAGSPPV